MTTTYRSVPRRTWGFFSSLKLALRIAVGAARLLWRYPRLVLPLFLVFILLLLALFSLLFIQTLLLAMFVIFAVAYALMFSFAISGQMMRQIEYGGKPSILTAITSPALVRMIPRVLILTSLWYVLVAILIAVETALQTVLDRISDNLAETVINFIFGTVADALRMAGFMLVAIMIFEDSGMPRAIARLRTVIHESPVTILGGLMLTKLVALVNVLAVMFLPESIGLLVLIPLAVLWVLGMYLEQIFVTGLYLYASNPESRLVPILLQGFVGKELPELPDDLLQKPVVGGSPS